MFIKMKKIALVASMFSLPLVAGAQQLDNIKTLASSVGDIINILIPIVFALAMLFFFWGLALYIFGGEHDKEKAKKTMIWGVVALFVMAAVWGLVNFLSSSLDIDTGTGPGFSPTDLVPQG